MQITLSSTDARASLAHCYAHMRANPKEALRFRFITNAKIGREKRIEGGIPGITLWQQVQVGDAKSAVYVRRLRKTLTGANRPDDVSSNEWALWQAFVASATDAEFTDFVCRYEWSCGFERIEDLDDRLRIALSSLSPTSLTREQALARGQSLLANLFERLTRPRPRTLTRADLLKTLQRANSTEALPFFWALVATKTFEQPPLSGTERRALTGKLAPTHLVPSPSQVSIVEQPPPIGARAVTRAKAISSIESRLSSDRWVNLSGAPGMGKTALVPRHRGFDRLERG